MLEVILFDGVHRFSNDDCVAQSLVNLKQILDNQYPEQDELFKTKRILNQAFFDHEYILKEFEKLEK